MIQMPHAVRPSVEEQRDKLASERVSLFTKLLVARVTGRQVKDALQELVEQWVLQSCPPTTSQLRQAILALEGWGEYPTQGQLLREKLGDPEA